MSTIAAVTMQASAETQARADYHLSPAEIAQFDAHGYLVLRGWIGGDLLARLQAAGQAWITQGYSLSADDPDATDFVFAAREHGTVLYRVNYVHNKRQPASLELLGAPQVLAVAESLCGPNFVPTYESMVFKQEGDGEAIPWHQDANHPRAHRIFNFDLYLDASRRGAGALRVVPGSQKRRHDVCALAQEHGWDVPEAIDVEMEPGDVLLHDVMLLHGSARVEGKALRRTIYYEFRAAEQILAEGPWDRAWIDRRLRLLPVALARYRAAFPQGPQFTWQADAAYRPATHGDEAEELKIVHVVHSGGSYCSAGDVTSFPGFPGSKVSG